MGRHSESARNGIQREAREDGRQTDKDGYQAGAGSRGEANPRQGGGAAGEAGHGDTPNR